jgi:hypothetical protein
VVKVKNSQLIDWLVFYLDLKKSLRKVKRLTSFSQAILKKCCVLKRLMWGRIV